jgi:flagellar biosynthetic protein FliQ
VNDTQVLNIAVQMLVEMGKLAAPVLIVSMAVGIGVSLLQSITQLQEATLSFVPKLAAVALVVVFAGHWMINSLVGFTDHMYRLIPALLHAG